MTSVAVVVGPERDRSRARPPCRCAASPGRLTVSRPSTRTCPELHEAHAEGPERLGVSPRRRAPSGGTPASSTSTACPAGEQVLGDIGRIRIGGQPSRRRKGDRGALRYTVRRRAPGRCRPREHAGRERYLSHVAEARIRIDSDVNFKHNREEHRWLVRQRHRSRNRRRRARQGSATRARLLDAAKSVFEETGLPRSPHLRHRRAGRPLPRLLLPLLRREGADLPRGRRGPGGTAHRARRCRPRRAGTDRLDRIRRANRRYLERYRANGKIMGVIEEVSATTRRSTRAGSGARRVRRRAERAIRRLQGEGPPTSVDPRSPPWPWALWSDASPSCGSSKAGQPFDLDVTVEQMTRLWANAIGLREKPRRAGAGDEASPDRHGDDHARPIAALTAR